MTAGGAVRSGNGTINTTLFKPRNLVTSLLEITELSKDIGDMTQPEMFEGKGEGNV